MWCVDVPQLSAPLNIYSSFFKCLCPSRSFPQTPLTDFQRHFLNIPSSQVCLTHNIPFSIFIIRIVRQSALPQTEVNFSS